MDTRGSSGGRSCSRRNQPHSRYRRLHQFRRTPCRGRTRYSSERSGCRSRNRSRTESTGRDPSGSRISRQYMDRTPRDLEMVGPFRRRRGCTSAARSLPSQKAKKVNEYWKHVLEKCEGEWSGWRTKGSDSKRGGGKDGGRKADLTAGMLRCTNRAPCTRGGAPRSRTRVRTESTDTASARS
jgi:hypothetical protein